MPDLSHIGVSAEAVGAVILALAALVNSIAYVLRRKADASAELVHSLLARVQQQDDHIRTESQRHDDRLRRLEARIAELEASLRASEGRERALLDENESLRDALDTGRVIPGRIGASRREDTGRHASLTQELLAERAHHDHHDGE
jgi:TolA-binding protein